MARKERERTESKGKVYLVPIRQIVANHNPRNPLSTELQKDGYGVFESTKKGIPSLWALATSDEPGDRAEYAHLIQEREPEIVSMAATILSMGQLQAVEVRDNGKTKEGNNTYTLIFGCRRVLASLYNWCVLGKPQEPLIEARLSPKLNEIGLLHRSLGENIRKPHSPLEEARAMQFALNNNETVEDLCKTYGVCEQTIRRKLALLQLPPKTQLRVAQGTLGETKALQTLRGDNATTSELEASKGKGVKKPPKMMTRREVEGLLEQLGKMPPDWMTAQEVLHRVLKIVPDKAPEINNQEEPPCPS